MLFVCVWIVRATRRVKTLMTNTANTMPAMLTTINDGGASLNKWKTLLSVAVVVMVVVVIVVVVMVVVIVVVVVMVVVTLLLLLGVEIDLPNLRGQMRMRPLDLLVHRGGASAPASILPYIHCELFVMAPPPHTWAPAGTNTGF